MSAALQPEKVVFGQSMEGLWRALDPATPAERAAFAKAGVTEPRNWQAGYALPAYMGIVEACASSRFGALEPQARFTAVGRLFFAGYEKTMVGQALMAMLRVLGPRRTLLRLTRNFRSANNFSEGEVEEKAPNHHVVRVKHVVYPGFYQGLIESGCERAGAKELVVALISFSPSGVATYEVRWR
jgi:uncharacterized protein (TIGR02265 family)